MKSRLIALLAAALCTLGALSATYSGTLPVMFVNTENSAPIVSKEVYLNATYYIDPMGVEGVKAVGSADQPLSMQIKGRGNWTWRGFDKKPYRIKLASKENLLGLGKNKHFALLAHADDSFGFLRNPVGFWLSRTVGMPWTPSEQPVEVVLNGDYIGLYFLTETIRVDKDRVNITEQSDLATAPDEITGGWLVEIDNYYDDPHVLIKEGDGADLVVTYKSPEVLSAEQEDYLKTQMETINRGVYSGNTAGCPWADQVDLPTLSKFYVTQEVMDNYESFHGSCYMNKQRGDNQKWMFGPVWDFGSTFNYKKSQYIYQGREHHMTWIGKMCTFPAFMDQVKAVWADFYPAHYQEMMQFVQDYADRIAQAAKCDAQRWPQYGNPDEQAKADLVKERLYQSCKWLAGKWGGEAPKPPYSDITLYYINDAPTPWQQVYVYSWCNSASGWKTLFGDWPGTRMTQTQLDGQPVWTITITPDFVLPDNTGLIFGNGGTGYPNQTADLILHNNCVYRFDGSYTPAGLSDVTLDSYGVSVQAVPGGVSVNAARSQSISITGVDGRSRIVRVTPGANTVSLAPGFYIIGGNKVVVTR